jgi:LPS-assembly lipoprotein
LLYNKIILAFSFFFLTGCGFEAIYIEKTKSYLESEIKLIEIKPIKNRVGQQIRNHLIKHIVRKDPATKFKYSLSITVTERKEELAIKKSEIATRANLTFQTQFSVINKTTKRKITSGTNRVITSYNILTSSFAGLMAEKDARKRAAREISRDILTKISVSFKSNLNPREKTK